MKKPTFIYLFLGLVIAVFGLSLLSKPKAPTPLPSSHEYFSLATCPHCQNVETFLSSWEGKDKISLDKKDISNAMHQKTFYERASYCKIAKEETGVPFLFTPDGTCIVGDEPIIEYLKNYGKNQD